MDRGAWRATVHGVSKSWAQLNNDSEQAEISSVCPSALYRLSQVSVETNTDVNSNVSRARITQCVEGRYNHVHISPPLVLVDAL